GGGGGCEARREAVEQLELMLSGVVAGRGGRYVVMNAHVDDLPAIRAVLPGMGAPSVLQLADDGEIAVHAAVEVDEIWNLLPVLRRAGATSILVLPIERLGACGGRSTTRSGRWRRSSPTCASAETTRCSSGPRGSTGRDR